MLVEELELGYELLWAEVGWVRKCMSRGFEGARKW